MSSKCVKCDKVFLSGEAVYEPNAGQPAHVECPLSEKPHDKLKGFFESYFASRDRDPVRRAYFTSHKQAAAYRAVAFPEVTCSSCNGAGWIEPHEGEFYPCGVCNTIGRTQPMVKGLRYLIDGVDPSSGMRDDS
jgi:hypothetical protein